MNDLSNTPPLDEMSRLAVAAREALTDQMVERLAVTSGNALELLDRLNDEATSAAVHSLIDRLTEMHRVGAIETACDLVMLAHGARSALTDSIIERLFTFAEQMLSPCAGEDIGEVVHNARVAFEGAAADAAKTPAKGGLMSTLSMLGKPETQRSLQFLVSFAGKLQNGATSSK